MSHVTAPLRLAIIGAGVWGETHAGIFRDHPFAQAVAICDLDEGRAARVAHAYGIPAVYTDYRDMLRRSDCDAVSIVTPDFLHADIAVACAEAGKHLLIEKPLATTRADSDRIVEAVERQGVRCMVDLHNRFSPPFAAAHEAVTAGELGPLSSAYFRLNDIKWVATDMLPWAAQSSILWFLGSHSTDTLRWLFGDEVERVYAVSSRGILSRQGVDTEDQFLTTLEFRGGGIAQMENGWITPNANTCINDIKCTLTGPKGQINIDASANRLIDKVTDTRVTSPDVLVNHYVNGKARGFAFESIRHFVDAVRTGEPFLVSLEDAVHTGYVILSIMESAQRREPVRVVY